MKLIAINQQNIEQEHICCAIGNDKENQQRSMQKKEWMRSAFADGLTFLRFDVRGKAFIEYIPIEKVWKPLVGTNYMAIHCLWVSGQFKGKGLSTQLLNACIADAKARNMDGIVAISSTKTKPYLTDKKFFIKQGFEVIDTAYPYFELLGLKFNLLAENPRFAAHVKSGMLDKAQAGISFVYSDQCPYMDVYVKLLENVCHQQNVTCQSIKLESHQEAQRLGSPFGTLGIYWNGIFKTHELMTEKKFEAYIETLKEESK